MASMTEKERFLATLLGGTADRFPFFDLEPYKETVRLWRRQGLPRRTSVVDYFGLEPHSSVGLELRSDPFYRKAPDLLTNPKSFRRHYDPDDSRRYVKRFEKRCKKLDDAGRVLYVTASGGGLLQMLGVADWETLVAACEALVRRPESVQALMERTTDFYCECLERVLSKVSVAYASFYEPIASNAGPVISPEMFERFAMPGYRKVIELVRKHDVPLCVMCTTGGDLSSLLQMFVDAGINGLWISNITSAEMEYSRLRQEYGPDVALIGGVDATALSRDEAAVRRAVMDTVPALLESGRYLPCLSDRPRENTSFPLYRLYRELLAELARRG
jgi:uroporphyrinogen-III decarboxylase